MKILDTKRLRVRKLTPNEYGVLQAFKMDSWVQVVSDSQAYKQFGNAVTVTLFEAVATNIKAAILGATESEELNMENQTMEKQGNWDEPTYHRRGNAQAVTTEEVTEEKAQEVTNILPYDLAAMTIKFLYDAGMIARACLTTENTTTLADHLEENLNQVVIGKPKEDLRNWDKVREELEKALEEYAALGPSGMYGIKGLTPLKVRMDQGERTPDLYNAIVAAVR